MLDKMRYYHYNNNTMIDTLNNKEEVNMDTIIKELVKRNDNKKILFVHPSGHKQSAWVMSKQYINPCIMDDNGLNVTIPWIVALRVIENGIYDMSNKI
jgi:hypothetical protein